MNAAERALLSEAVVILCLISTFGNTKATCPIPNFDDFDLNRDGLISRTEHDQLRGRLFSKSLPAAATQIHEDLQDTKHGNLSSSASPGVFNARKDALKSGPVVVVERIRRQYSSEIPRPELRRLAEGAVELTLVYAGRPLQLEVRSVVEIDVADLEIVLLRALRSEGVTASEPAVNAEDTDLEGYALSRNASGSAHKHTNNTPVVPPAKRPVADSRLIAQAFSKETLARAGRALRTSDDTSLLPPLLPSPPPGATAATIHLPPAAAQEEYMWIIIYDDDTTCTTEERLYGGEAQRDVNNGYDKCAAWCLEYYPSTRFTDYWPNGEVGRGWCNCYKTCPDKRCVSYQCMGRDGADVRTQELSPMPPPPSPNPPCPLSPPPVPPLPPVLPPAPPLTPAMDGELCKEGDNVTGVIISDPIPEYAAAHLRSALYDPTVTLVCLTTNASSTFGAFPTVNRTVKILGGCNTSASGCEITTNGKDRILATSEGGLLRLEGLLLRGGYNATHGGALYVGENSGADLRHCTLEDNEVGEKGGAIYVASGSNLSVVSSRFESNAAWYGSGVCVDPGSIVWLRNGTVLSFNRAGAKGGAIFMDTGTIYVDSGVELYNNSAGGHGGGLYLIDSNATIVGARLLRNYAAGRGGGLACVNCDIRVNDTVVADNIAGEPGGAFHLYTTKCVAEGIRVDNNTAGWLDRDGLTTDGGGIYLYENTVMHMRGCIVRENRVTTGNGGGIFLNERSTLVMDGACLVTGNTGMTNGGGIYGSENTSITIEGNSVVESNRAEGSGGGIFSIGSENVSTVVVLQSGCAVRNNTAGTDGGGLACARGCMVQVQDAVSIAFNRAGLSGAGAGGGIAITAGSIRLAGGSRCSHNQAHKGGGVAAEGTNLTMEGGSELAENEAWGDGGGMYAGSSIVSIGTGSTIRANVANEDGGGLYADNVRLKVSGGAVMMGNCADGNGGGAYVSNLSFATINRSMLTLNFADEGGGALSLHKSAGSLEGTVILNNSAFRDGGGLFVDESNITLTSCNVSTNLAQRNGGGAYAANTVQAVVEAGTEIADNYARENGGGLLVYGMTRLTVQGGSSVLRNRAGKGGGLLLVDSQLTVSAGSVLSSNYAYYEGGHIFMSNCSLAMEDSKLQQGSTSGRGGALHANHKSSVAVHQCDISSCSAQQGGGGIAVQDSRCVMSDVDIHSCSAGTNGGAVFLERGAVASISSAAMWSNEADGDGGALWADTDSVLNLSTTTMTDNRAYSGAGVALTAEVRGVNLTSLTLQGGSAATGGGVSLQPNENASVVGMRGLYFHNNSAGVGENIYWVHHEAFPSSMQPSCVDCAHPSGTSLFRTNAVTFVIMQNGSSLPSSGWSTAGLASFQMLFAALDFYGNITALPYENVVSVSTNTASASIGGQTIAVFERYGGANFSSLVLVGDPGSSVEIMFFPQSAEWESVSLDVSIDICSNGEVHDISSQSCRRCPPGALKFSNTSSPCSTCPADRLACPGGSVYTVEQGAWIAPSAEQCDVEDMDCFMALLYKCIKVEACRTDAVEERTGDSLASVANLKLCDEMMYGGGVLCGGDSLVVCGEGFSRSPQGTECERCPGLVVLVMRAAIIGLILAALLALLILRFVNHLSDNVESVTHEGLRHALVLRKAQTALSILVGYCQVMGQLTSIFSLELLPGILKFFLVYMHFINLDVSNLFKSQCLLYHSGVGGRKYIDSSTRNYWQNFDASLSYPWIVPAILAVAYVTLVRVRRRQDASEHKQWKKSMQAASCAMTSVYWMFIHPSVGTNMFQLFNCMEYYYESLDRRDAWLYLNTNVQCFTQKWYVAVLLACATLLVFVIGFPLGMYLFMRYLRQWHKVCICNPAYPLLPSGPVRGFRE
ncbi:hypothetical protein CYMTET_11354 [Cymbomonas tetramitiformis]|uniref:Pectate lyase C n=1 Tax=Cymbomonas tetramitiformis TaxID=36881 RepID=A0AAE0LDJ6_9CHLO|nr:hypothetical protein CYMTET_11354 [Cymbomonas tetramitiformis]